MTQITIAHFINPFLPLTQNWMYHQLRCNTECRNIVLCRTLENTAYFPFENVFPAFPKRSLAADISMFFSRLRARYPAGYYLSAIEREKPRLLHGHFSWESWRNIGIVKKLRLPLITTFYGLDVGKLSRQWIWKRRYARLFEIGDIFTAEGAHMAEELERIGCPGKKIRIISLGVDREALMRFRVQPSGETIRIMFVGLEREKKGPLFAAAAFAKVAYKNVNCEFHIVGNGPYAAPVKKLLARRGVINKCVFHGYVPFETYCRLLGQMDIVMAPSVVAKNGDSEGGAPVVVIEAQALGIPVVGTKHCDIPNIVMDKKTGLLCEERDIEALTDNLNSLVVNQEIRKSMGAAARIHAAENFSIERQIRELNAIYRSLII